MFWGITLESGKKYTQVLQKSFCVTMAAIGFENPSNDRIYVMAEVNKAQHVLCSLQSGKLPQQGLNLHFTEGEQVSFFIEGEGEVHLTGYLTPEDNDSELSDESSCEEDEEDEEDEKDVQNKIVAHLTDLHTNGINVDIVSDVSCQGMLCGGSGQEPEEVNTMNTNAGKQPEEYTQIKESKEVSDESINIVGGSNCEKKLDYPGESAINSRLKENEMSISRGNPCDGIPIKSSCNGIDSECSSSHEPELHCNGNFEDETNSADSDQSDSTYQLAGQSYSSDEEEEERVSVITRTRKRSANNKMTVVPDKGKVNKRNYKKRKSLR